MFKILVHDKKNYNVSIQMNYYFYFENILFEDLRDLLREFLFYYEFEFLNWIY